MKAMMMSIKPEWVAKILNGEKTIEIRKKFPSDYVGWVYIYCTKNGDYLMKAAYNNGYIACMRSIQPKQMAYSKSVFNGKVVARFWCDKVEDYVYGHKWSWEHGAPMWGADNSYEKILQDACLTDDELRAYVEDLSFSAIHITKLEIFDKPKEISEFKYYKKFSEIDYMLPIPRKETCERLVALTRAPQSYCLIEI